MNNNDYNEQRHNRQKQFCRFILGVQQLIYHPLINLIWLLFAGGVVALVIAKSKLIYLYDANPLLNNVFEGCMNAMVIIIPIICVIGLIQFIGVVTAIRDEADMSELYQMVMDNMHSSTVLTAWDGDKLIGLVRVLDDTAMLAVLHYVLVDPAYHGRGIAGKMIEMVKEKYKEFLYIEGMPEESKNAPFYQKHGFHIMEDGVAMQIVADWAK